MSRAKENASLSSRLRSDPGALVTSDTDSLETLAIGTDGQFLQADSTEPLGMKWADPSGIGTVTSVGVTTTSAGLSVSGTVTGSGDLTVNLDADLNAVAALSTTGYVKRTGAATWTTSATVAGSDVSGNIAGTASGITGVSLGDAAVKNTGTVAGTLAAGDDSRFLSTAQKTDLTDTGDSILHYHATDRDLANATGTLAIANGGTGQATAQAAINALTQVSAASAGQVLTKSGTDATWVSPAGAGLGDVTTTGATVADNLTAFLDTSGDVIKDSGIATSAVVTLTGTQTLTNKTLTSPAITTPTGIVKGDVGLGNVDNTSDVTKNAATATLTNKTMSIGSTWNGAAIGALYGGTAQSSWTKGDILYSSAANTLAKLPVGVVGQALTVSSAGIPQWSTLSGLFGNTVGANQMDPYWTTSTEAPGSPVQIGLGTQTSPITITDAYSPSVFFNQAWVSTDFVDGSAACVPGGYVDVIHTGGTGGVTGMLVNAKVATGATPTGGVIGLHCVGSARFGGNSTSYGAAGLWNEVESSLYKTAGLVLYAGQEVNSYTNFQWNTTTEYAHDPFISTIPVVVNLLMQNFKKYAEQNSIGAATSFSQYQNSFGLALTSLNGYGRSFGFQTGAYFSDCSKEAIRIRGGVYGYTDKFTDYGIKFEGTACSVAGIALGPNKLNWGTGSAAGTVSNEGDMLYNDVSNILYFNQGGTLTEGLFSSGVGTSGSYTADRKVTVKIGGTTYYLLASTT